MKALQSAFGEHPSDVLSTLVTMIDSLMQLEAIFSYLPSDLGKDSGVLLYARELLRTGAHLAGFSADLAKGRVEQYQSGLREAGMLPN